MKKMTFIRLTLALSLQRPGFPGSPGSDQLESG